MTATAGPAGRRGRARCGTAVRLVALGAAVLTVLAVTGAPAAPAQASSSACSSRSTSPSTRPADGTRPVVFVHGWMADGGALKETGKALTARTGNRITPYYFDYGAHRTTWASADAVAGCLAKYLAAVSATYGGDGKVLVVAHSMGGLATLYAARRAGAAELLGGVVTFATPYLGSPFGETWAAGFWQDLHQHGSTEVPPPGSDAQVCLGPHPNGGANMPDACASTLPSYLPASVPLTAIAGSATVRRTLGPFHLYDIPLSSDGIVPVSSAHGYLPMNPREPQPRGVKVSLRTDACTITSDSLLTAAVALGWSKSALAALAAGIGQMAVLDDNTFDGILSGNLTPGLVAYLAAVEAAASCSHGRLYKGDVSLNHATDALISYLDQLGGGAPAPSSGPSTFQATQLGTSRYSDEYRAAIRAVRPDGFLLHVDFDASGRNDLRKPETSCVTVSDGSTSRRLFPVQSTLSTNSPGRYTGTLTFALAAPGSYGFTYSCASDYSTVALGTAAVPSRAVSVYSRDYFANILDVRSVGGQTVIRFAAAGRSDLRDPATSCLRTSGGTVKPTVTLEVSRRSSTGATYAGTMTFNARTPATFVYSCLDDYSSVQF
ncbi:alpha/beta hydrolase [Frankia sp. CNm7]|uniref:Alpha/beta hydrolase n=1 Tax=Frankia nepalensis TaxID=1836974 RepID=A0A937RM48_9ACTN|nr:alpha/beta hydrolase [Frankia nepalensis]MBL7495921.1 alpha/beta hydrolase [Frankia nepalensis]MBL7513849.1 alpha/beta hydrolase [Frankia nepalensis]MBL7524827.1 alpha/beta hydrolase [Frankia nepalensis]MBL7632647.1 alpha/beta hydrolase [Frankia nepalensis]